MEIAAHVSEKRGIEFTEQITNKLTTYAVVNIRSNRLLSSNMLSSFLVVKHAFIISVAYKPLYTLLCLLVRLSLILIFHVCKDTIFTHQPCRRCTMGCLRSKYILISLWAKVKENALEIKKKKNYWYFDFNRYINYDFKWDINFAVLFLYNWFYLFNRMLHNCTPS